VEDATSPAPRLDAKPTAGALPEPPMNAPPDAGDDPVTVARARRDVAMRDAWKTTM